MKLYFSIMAALVVGTAQAQTAPQVIRNAHGEVTATITSSPSGVGRITAPDGSVQGYVNHSTGRITNSQGATTGYVTPMTQGQSRITSPTGETRGYVHHSSGRITNSTGVTTGYASKR